MAADVTDVQPSFGADGDAARVIQMRGLDRAPVTRVAELAGAGHGGDPAFAAHLADPVVDRAGDVERAEGVDGNSVGEAQDSLGGGQAVAVEGGQAGAGGSFDFPVGGDVADAGAWVSAT